MRLQGARWVGWSALALCGVLAFSCGGSSEAKPPARGLRQLMYDVNVLYLQLQGNHQNAAALPEIAQSLGTLHELSRDPLFSGWTARPQFQGDKALFESLRLNLESAAVEGRSAALAGNTAELRAAYIKAGQSCIACHKRFQATY